MFDQVFDQIPVSNRIAAYWARQDRSSMDAAAAVIDAHEANPWVFAADARHFWQFASAADVAAYQAMSPEQFAAICGDWEEEDHDPTSFGYSWPV